MSQLWSNKTHGSKNLYRLTSENCYSCVLSACHDYLVWEYTVPGPGSRRGVKSEVKVKSIPHHSFLNKNIHWTPRSQTRPPTRLHDTKPVWIMPTSVSVLNADQWEAAVKIGGSPDQRKNAASALTKDCLQSSFSPPTIPMCNTTFILYCNYEYLHLH